MLVGNVFYGRRFEAQFKNLPEALKKLAVKKDKLFRANPLHPSLRLHPLKGKLIGLWSISLTLNYRMIFKRMRNGDILFVSVGKHDLYASL